MIKKKKNIIGVILLLVIISIYPIYSYAEGIDSLRIGALVDPIENPGEYKPSENPVSNNTQFIERGNLVIGVIQILGSAISVITLMTLGIRYMLAGVQEKALYKETMGPYLIGAVMVFAIPNIIAVLYDFVTSNIKDI